LLLLLHRASGGDATSTAPTATEQLQYEIRTYYSLQVNQVHTANDDVLQFWKSHTTVLPLLSQIAASYLGISASSVPVESLFSTAGLVLNGKRSSLSPEHLNKIVFIHDNFKVISDSLTVHELKAESSTSRPTFDDAAAAASGSDTATSD